MKKKEMKKRKKEKNKERKKKKEKKREKTMLFCHNKSLFFKLIYLFFNLFMYLDLVLER